MTTNEVKDILANVNYADMSKEELEAVSSYEFEQFKPRVVKLLKNHTPEDVGDMIDEWWRDYQMADETEDKLLEFIGI